MIWLDLASVWLDQRQNSARRECAVRADFSDPGVGRRRENIAGRGLCQNVFFVGSNSNELHAANAAAGRFGGWGVPRPMACLVHALSK